jgi:hypothetical protein
MPDIRQSRTIFSFGKKKKKTKFEHTHEEAIKKTATSQQKAYNSVSAVTYVQINRYNYFLQSTYLYLIYFMATTSTPQHPPNHKVVSGFYGFEIECGNGSAVTTPGCSTLISTYML